VLKAVQKRAPPNSRDTAYDAGSPSTSAALAIMVEQARAVTSGDGAAVALCDREGVICLASAGIAPEVGSRPEPDARLTWECVETGRVTICENADTDSRVPPSSALSLRLRSALAVPIPAQDSVLGVLEVFSSRPSAFDSAHIAALEGIANALALVLNAEPREEEGEEEEEEDPVAVAAAALATAPAQRLQFEPQMGPPSLILLPAEPPSVAPLPLAGAADPGAGVSDAAGGPVAPRNRRLSRQARWPAAGAGLLLLVLLLLLFFLARTRDMRQEMGSQSRNPPPSWPAPAGAKSPQPPEKLPDAAADQKGRAFSSATPISSSPVLAALAQKERSGPSAVAPSPLPATVTKPSKTQPSGPPLKPGIGPATPPDAKLPTPDSQEASADSVASPSPADRPPSLPEFAKVANLPVPLTLPPTPRLESALPEFVLGRTFDGHSGWVTSIAFTPDGQRLASGSRDETVKFWEVPSGEQLNTVARKIRGVEALAFSRDGHLLAAENSADAVTVWDATTGQELRTFRGNPSSPPGTSWVYSIAFSPDGHWLAAGVDDKTVRLWDVQTGQVVRDIVGRQRAVIYASFSPDGRLLATGADRKTIEVSLAATGQVVQTLRGHKDDVFAVAFSPDSRWLASASGDKSVKLWDVSTGNEVRTFIGHRSRVTTLAFSPAGRWLATGSWDHTIKIWNIETGREVQTLAKDTRPVYTLCFNPDGRWLASGSEDGKIKFWKLSEPNPESSKVR
jgi:WD40 repeat protein